MATAESSRSKITPWASAAGAAALILGSVAGFAGSASAAEVKGAAAAASPAQTGSTISMTPASATPFVAKSSAKASTPTAKSAKGAYKYFDSDFILRLRAAAIEVEPDIPHPLVPGVGYAAVNLEKETGGDASCEILGAGFYLTDVAQEGVLENSGPPDAGNKGGGIFNPTEAKDTAPNLSPGANLNARTPQVRDVTDGHSLYDIPAHGNGVRWEAHCDNDAGGKAVGNNVDIAGVQAIGSTTVGAIDKVTGVYTGTSRAFVAGLETGSGTLDFVSSVTKITHLPGKEPTVTYAIGLAGGTLVSGANIPASDLTKQFNDAVKTGAGALAALGPLGVTLMGPTITESENGHRPIINMPFFDLSVGIDARKGTVGENQHVRLVNIDYEGQYTQ